MTPPLLDALARPEVWPGGGPVEVRQTHLSIVILTPRWAFKVKKPVSLGFVDFSSLEVREQACHDEVRLNRRWADHVYEGVIPLVETTDGLRAGAPGEPVEFAVQMRRLPDEATLLDRLERGALTWGDLDAAAARIARGHAEARTSPEVVSLARARVAINARENFDQTRDHVGPIVTAPVWERLRDRTEALLDTLGPIFDQRARLARDGHGDLRLEHVYRLVDGSVQVLDCVEFADRYRWCDPVSDVAFLVMDLQVRGRWALASRLFWTWAEAMQDEVAPVVLPFYLAYRSAVRAKVSGMQHLDPALPDARRALCLGRARRHWLFALAAAEVPSRRPCLVGVGGLPGTGKSTLARGLAERAGFEVIRSDVVRKELAGIDPLSHPVAGYEQGLYSPANKDRVYDECLRRAREVLARGGRAVIDASYSRERWREQLLDAAVDAGAPGMVLWCDAPAAAARARLDARGPDASDADFAVYQRAADATEPFGPGTSSRTARVDTGATVDDTVARGIAALTGFGLAQATTAGPSGTPPG